MICLVASILGIWGGIQGFDVAIVLLTLILLIYCLLQKQQVKKSLLIAMIFFMVFSLRGISAEMNNESMLSEGHLEIEGTITGVPRINGDSMQLQIRLDEGERLQASGFFKSEAEQHKWSHIRPGMSCRFTGSLTHPRLPTNFYQFNYQTYLYEQSIHWVYQLNPEQTFCNAESGTWADRFNGWRMDRMEQILSRYHEDVAGLIIALTYGDRYFIDQDILQAYQKLGVIHLLAVSGLHVGMLTAAAMYLLIRIGLTRERAMELLLFALPFYAFAAGAAPPVIRAAAMSFVVLLCLRLKKKIQPMLGISFIFLLYLLLKPYVLFQLGFQLSFLVSFSLILSAQSIQSLCTSYLGKTMAVTLIAQLLTLPLILYHFFEWNLISIPLNLIYIPFVTLLVLPASFLASLFDIFLPTAVNIPYFLLQSVVSPVHQVLTYINQFPLLSYSPGKLPVWFIGVLYVCIVLVMLMWESQIKYWWAFAMVLLLVPLVGIKLPPYFNTEATVTMLDVGQGDSFVIELPRREAVFVIDTGGVIRFSEEPWRNRRNQFNTGKDILIPHLKAKGISTIDYLILTHGDHDHIGGAEALLDRMKVKELIYGKGPVEKENEIQVLSAYRDAGTVIRMTESGKTWSFGENRFAILAPDSSDHETDTNERSIVLAASIKGVNWLFTGDLGEKGERRLLERYPSIQTDVLKVGHHGSLTSSSEEFLDQLQPNVVMISAGKDNRYGHPHPEILSRLQERQMSIWRTDLHGAVQYQLNGQGIKVKTALPQDETGPK